MKPPFPRIRSESLLAPVLKADTAHRIEEKKSLSRKKEQLQRERGKGADLICSMNFVKGLPTKDQDRVCLPKANQPQRPEIEMRT